MRDRIVTAAQELSASLSPGELPRAERRRQSWAAVTIRSRTVTVSAVLANCQPFAVICRIVSAVRFHLVHVARDPATASTTRAAACIDQRVGHVDGAEHHRRGPAGPLARVRAHSVGSVPRTALAVCLPVLRPRPTGMVAFFRSRVARVMCCRIRFNDRGRRVAARCVCTVRSTAVSTAASMSAERCENTAINASGTPGISRADRRSAAARVRAVPTRGRSGG